MYYEISGTAETCTCISFKNTSMRVYLYVGSKHKGRETKIMHYMLRFHNKWGFGTVYIHLCSTLRT
jgi:hypothetical protein